METTKACQMRIMLIGLGHHAVRTYVKHIDQLRAEGHSLALKAVVDVVNARETVTQRMQKLEAANVVELSLVDGFTGSLPVKVEVELNRLVRKHQINAVIVATVPEVHAAYVKWALRSNLSVLVDKPFSTRVDAANDIDAAKGIIDDLVSTLDEYRKAKTRAGAEGKRVCALMNVQRRHHPAYRYIENLISEVADRTGCGLTHISAHHEDGQFRLPGELVGIDYHGYNAGHGKLSHSGYHVLDASYRFARAGWRVHNKPDFARITSSFITAGAFLKQVPMQFYRDYFGKGWEASSGYKSEEVRSVAGRLGEMDAALAIEFVKDEDVVGHAGISLLHNSVSQRHWLHPNADLYKSQGRIKGEKWQLVSGPFQSISVEVRQAEHKHDCAGVKGTEPGAPNHMQLIVVRNSGVLGGKPIEVLQGKDLGSFDDDRMHGEQVKMSSLRELLRFVTGEIEQDELVADLGDYVVPSSWMSAGYQSHVRKRAGGPCHVDVSL